MGECVWAIYVTGMKVTATQRAKGLTSKRNHKLLQKKRISKISEALCVVNCVVTSLCLWHVNRSWEVKEKGDLWMNALLEPKFCILEKP